MKALSVERDVLGRFKKWDYGPLADRFWAMVQKTDTCWLWMGARNKQGYGTLKINGKMERAPRVAYQLSKGPIPEGCVVMHACDNPLCVNPSHLVPGKPLENTADMINKGRMAKVDYRLAQKKGAEIKAEKALNVTLPCVLAEVRRLISSGIKPTLRRCQFIPKYNGLLGHYLRHEEIIALAREEER
jgi:hypothetical protein